MEPEVATKLAIYEHFAATGTRPSADELADRLGAPAATIREHFTRLRAQRVLVLEPDGGTIRMAPPFSGIPTQHRVVAGGVGYFANCAWDALGILAALHRPGTVHSRCERTLEPLELPVHEGGPEASDWVFHCLVPAARWWADIVFT